MHWVFSIFPRSRNPHRMVRCLQCRKGNRCVREQQIRCFQECQTTEMYPLIDIFSNWGHRQGSCSKLLCLRFSAATNSRHFQAFPWATWLLQGVRITITALAVPVRFFILVKWDCNFIHVYFRQRQHLYWRNKREKGERETTKNIPHKKKLLLGYFLKEIVHSSLKTICYI